MVKYKGTLTDVENIHLMHAQNEEARTGLSVVLAPKGAVAGVDVRGAAPGTRETDLLRSENMIQKVHAVVLTGGSAFGLAASDGVMRALEEENIGFSVEVTHVPIVCSAVLFDLAVGSSKIRPDAEMGYLAAKRALHERSDTRQGPYGAGCGATVGKMLPFSTAQRSGIGMASLRLPMGGTISCMVAVNAVGDVVHPITGQVLACGTVNGKKTQALPALLGEGIDELPLGRNTTIAVVATDVALSKPEANRLAAVAHDGYALAIRPVHTMNDGDTIFALSTADKKENPAVLQAAAVEVVWRAIVNIFLNEEIDKDVVGSNEEEKAPSLVFSSWEACSLFPKRARNTHKGQAGHALLVAGQSGMAGAAQLCTLGALRGGAGLVTCACGKESVLPYIQTNAPSAMALALEEEEGRITVGCEEKLHSFSQKTTAFGIGCGLGTGLGAKRAVYTLLKQKKPTVLDADALNLLSQDPSLRALLHDQCILTPHEGEMARLLHRNVEDRLKDAQMLSRTLGVTVLLKGADTLIASSDGRIKINSTGTPAMATGGSGDVLTGVITALLCQGLSPFDAACLGAYWHGLAGEIAQEEWGLYSVTAQDLAACLGKAALRANKA